MIELHKSPYLQFNLTSAPQRALNNRNYEIPVASAVGGGTVINGIFFDRAAAADYDAWEDLGAKGWKFTDLLPYFRKSENFTPPNADHAKEFGIEWDLGVHGKGGPIESSYPQYQFPAIKKFFEGWRSLGVGMPKDPAGGDKEGAFWCPSTLDPRDETRSYARRGHYDRIVSRKNYHLLAETIVSKIVFEGKKATGVEYIPRKGDTARKVVKAKKEIILSAGSLHTPQILQLSGVGSRKLLEGFKIEVVEDLPGVGQNFQDHPTIYANFTFQAYSDAIPHIEMLYEPTYRAAQLENYRKNRTGPFTIAKDGGNVVAFLSLPTIAPNDYQRIVDLSKSQTLSSVYPPSTDATVLAGYSAQRTILQKLLSGKTAPVIEIGWNTHSIMPITLTKPFSRGTVTIQGSDIYQQPTIDFGVLSDPTDLEMLISIVNITRTLIKTPAMQELRPVENIPGGKFVEKKELGEAIKENLNPTYVHPCCTAGMMRRDLGGVVDENLSVYGVQGLSVVDASVFPLIPATHPSATLYALSEKVGLFVVPFV